MADTDRRIGARRLMRLLALVSPHKGRFLIATAALFVGSAFALAYPQGARYAIDRGIADGSMTRLNLAALVMLGIFAGQAGLTWVRHYLMSWLGERAVADLRRQVFDRLLTLPHAWFHERRTGEIVGRLASDVTTIQGVVGSELSLAMRNAAQFVGGVVLLFVESPGLTLFMLAIVPPLTLGVVLFGRQIRKMSKVVQDRVAESSAQVQEVVGGIATVQSFVREDHEGRRYGQDVEAVFDAAVHLARWRASFFSTASVAGYLGIVCVIWMGGRDVAAGTMSAGDLTAFLLYTLMVSSSLAGLTRIWGALQRAAGATERLFEVIETEPEIRDAPDARPLPAGGGGRFEYDGVGFRYPSRLDQAVLDGVSLAVEPGEVIAVVGPSGAGKTTLTALLQRFYDVDEGAVRVDGVDVRSLRLAELRRAISVVDQEPILFSGTIRENIAYGRIDATVEEIETAARDANAHDFVTAFPEGYDTLVGERGIKLSGGQKQRVAIARALLADPRILILDEATSNLDAESEAQVQGALARLMAGRTTLVVAHRLSTVRDADRIVVLEHGRVVEIGRHEDLMREEGTYRRLIEHQLVEGAA